MSQLIVSVGARVRALVPMSVKNPAFGARGDGVTDDTAAFQRALNALSALGGGKLRVPASSGAYIVGALTVPANVVIEGDGVKTVISPNAANITMFSSTSGAATAVNVAYRSFKVDCGSLTGVTVFSSVYSSDIEYANLTFVGGLYTIIADRGNRFTVRDCKVYGNASQPCGEMKFWSSNDTEYIFNALIERYQIINQGYGTQPVGIYLRRNIHSLLSQCVCTDMHMGNATPGTWLLLENDCQGVKVQQCIADACTLAVFQQGAGVAAGPTFCSLIDCDSDQNYSSAVVFSKSEWNSIIGGQYTASNVNTTGCAVTINSTASHITIDGVRFDGWTGAGGTAINAGADGTASNHVSVADCEFTSCTTAFNFVVPPTNWLITGCRFDASVTNSITKNGNWAGTNNNAIANLKWNPQSYVTVPAVPASGSNVVNNNAVSCQVFMSGGTISNLSLNSQALPVNTPMFIMEPGDVLNIAYSVAPTWQWVGLR